jgi:outer membrane protein OmpA-like peptidoglycan-associated protein
LDTTINKINTEGAAVALNDSTMVFTSLRTDKKEYTSLDDSATGIKRKLYLAKKAQNKWQFKGEFSKLLNDATQNNGNACFSPDGQRIYFSRCKPNEQSEMICAIYVSEKRGQNWSEPVKLPKEINDPKYGASMPSIAIDPTKGNDVIYFVSNKKDGRGGMDIWYSSFDKKNKVYKEPKNAGAKINTAGDELSPFYDNESRSLYFSSDGLAGLGGFDIYRVTGNGKKWLDPENIGRPYNTGADDIFFTISVNRREGFFVSNRKGGTASKNSTCCDDIYFYQNYEYNSVPINGTIQSTDPGGPVYNANIEVYQKDIKTKEKYLIKTIQSDSAGRYTTELEANRNYILLVKKNEFLATIDDISTFDIKDSLMINRNIIVAPKPKQALRIPNIQYEFNKSDMLLASKMAIDTTLLVLMEANPEIIIEIQSHTDNKGSDVYNLKLSQKRAESVVKYLESKGISAKRLKAKGYGESSPIAANENTDGSDNPDGRALNRRTDFKIIGDLPVELIDAGEKDSD